MKFSLAITLFLAVSALEVDAQRNLGGKGGKGAKGGKKGNKKGMSKTCRSNKFKCPYMKNYPAHDFGGTVAIANRGAGSISLVDPHTLETVVEEFLPDGGEPLYFAFSENKQELWVGDRANNRNVIYRMVGCKLMYDGYVDAPDGVFHSISTQASDVDYKLAATIADIDNSIVAHDLTTRRFLGKMMPPQEAVDAGAKPHDVTANADYVFATFLGSDNGVSYVASYKSSDFSLVSVLKTAADPHVAVRDDSYLFIAAQGGEVLTVTIPDLTVVKRIELPSPHGMFLSHNLKYLYITNIAEGGHMAIEVFNASNGKKLHHCPEVITTFPVPHNPTLSMDGSMLFLTHSGGTSTKNSAFDIMHNGCVDPYSERVFDTNLNPFGLIVVPAAADLLVCTNE